MSFDCEKFLVYLEQLSQIITMAAHKKESSKRFVVSTRITGVDMWPFRFIRKCTLHRMKSTLKCRPNNAETLEKSCRHNTNFYWNPPAILLLLLFHFITLLFTLAHRHTKQKKTSKTYGLLKSTLSTDMMRCALDSVFFQSFFRFMSVLVARSFITIKKWKHFRLYQWSEGKCKENKKKGLWHFSSSIWRLLFSFLLLLFSWLGSVSCANCKSQQRKEIFLCMYIACVFANGI